MGKESVPPSGCSLLEFLENAREHFKWLVKIAGILTKTFFNILPKQWVG